MRIAITGGIGAGKSYVCTLLRAHGIEVYDCDSAAKRLMATSALIRERLQQLVGPAVYSRGTLQKAVLAAYLLQSEQHKQAVNDIVHPAVAADFISSGLTWLESAILFDSGFDRRVRFDRVVCVTAPRYIRVQRIMARDNISESRALEWINRHIPQERMRQQSDYEIVNDGVCDLDSQINNILNRL